MLNQLPCSNQVTGAKEKLLPRHHLLLLYDLISVQNLFASILINYIRRSYSLVIAVILPSKLFSYMYLLEDIFAQFDAVNFRPISTVKTLWAPIHLLLLTFLYYCKNCSFMSSNHSLLLNCSTSSSLSSERSKVMR